MLVDLPEDILRILAKHRVRLNLGDFDGVCEVIKAWNDEVLKPPLPRNQKLKPRNQEAWPPHKIWVIGGQLIDPGASQAEQLGNALQVLARLPCFLKEFSEHCKKRGGKRMYISQNRESLYQTDSLAIRNQAREIPGFPGWWFGTNYSWDTKRDIIKLACEIAGTSFDEKE